MNELVVPEGWKLKKLSDKHILACTKGKKPKHLISKKERNSIPYILIKEMSGIQPQKFTNDSDCIIANPSEILLSWDGTIGKTAIGLEGAVGSTIMKITPKEEVLPKFLYYFLKSKFKILNQNPRGGSIPHINPDVFFNLEILYPEDKKTQERIVQKLDNILMKLNKKLKIILETQDKQIQLSKKQKKKFYQYVLDNACFGKFTTDWKLKNSIESIPSRILELNDDTLVESSIRKQFPKEWCLVNLKPISEIRSGVTLGRSLHGDLITLPYLRVANVQDGYLDLRKIKQVSIKPEEKEKWLLNKGDILLTEGGDWDKLGRGTVWEDQIKDCIHQNHIFRVRLNPEEFNPYFVSFVLSSTYGKQYFQKSAKRTTNLASINSTQLKAFPMLCPTLSEQNEIVKIVNEKIYSTKILEDKINEYMKMLGKSKNYIKQLSLSILDQTFSGKLVN